MVEITGPTAAEHLMRKGRRSGLWMNVGKLEVQGAPSLYLAACTSPPLLKDPSAGAYLGLPGPEAADSIAGQVSLKNATSLDQFFQLKESEEIYGTSPGASR